MARTCGRSVGKHRFDHVTAYSESEKIKSFGGEKDDNDNDNDNDTLSKGPPTNVRNVALYTMNDRVMTQ